MVLSSMLPTVVRGYRGSIPRASANVFPSELHTEANEMASSLFSSQRPQFAVYPIDLDYRFSRDALTFLRDVGWSMDDWQSDVLDGALRSETGQSRWATPVVGAVTPRQNGTTHLAEARELLGAVQYGERVAHTAESFAGSKESFARMRRFVENSPLLRPSIEKIRLAHGHESIHFHSGGSIRYVARSAAGGRGFGADLVVIDDAEQLQDATQAAILPVVSGSKNCQIWYTGIPVDYRLNPKAGQPLARLRAKARELEPNICWFEYGAPDERATEVIRNEAGEIVKNKGDLLIDVSDPAVIADANPAYGHRIQAWHIESELQLLDRRSFERDRLGIWHDDAA